MRVLERFLDPSERTPVSIPDGFSWDGEWSASQLVGSDTEDESDNTGGIGERDKENRKINFHSIPLGSLDSESDEDPFKEEDSLLEPSLPVRVRKRLKSVES